jgi:hypothetical protein
MQWFDTKILKPKLQLLPKVGLYLLKNPCFSLQNFLQKKRSPKRRKKEEILFLFRNILIPF